MDGRDWWAGPSRYLPIADHGLIGDLRTVALVGTDGTIDWYCCPSFDAPSVFASILDADRGGCFELAADAPARSKQFYIPDTSVLITRFFTDDGVGEVQDFMPIIGDAAEVGRHRLIRRVICVRGSIPMRMRVAPRFDYARQPHTVRVEDRATLFEAESLSLALTATVPIDQDGPDARASFKLHEGESEVFALDRVGGDIMTRHCPHAEAEEQFAATVAFWRRWLAASRYRGRWREMVHRSALTLKLLTYAPTGAIVAAPTSSLPEQLGGERNWDYRYVWIRDAGFCVYALLRLGFTDEARAFMKFLSERFSLRGQSSCGPLQIMYGIDGRRGLPERELDHLAGYQGSVPVRIGNAAADQLQLDIYGALLDSVYLYDKWGEPISSGLWDEIGVVVDWVCEHWNQPDEGVWETRGGRENFLYSRLMCWVAVERAMRIAIHRGLPADIPRWRTCRDAIYHQIMRRGWSARRSAFVQRLDGDVLDASVLMMPLAKFVSPTDPKWLSTLDALGEELVSDSLVYRYDPAVSPDGVRGEEGTFSICSFWYVEALTRAGRLDEARLAFEKMLTYANHVGLYAEQISRAGEQQGNFPQAFTHLGLISAAFNLDRALG
ncbi:glycoside hydrolase family 15 protein [Frankia sp. CNm7]|uniref:Glycoside hydrolase family 15 protein n=1 Tax=Frankia nepalensis TaxID=1836974 RepID=A0A937RQF5_9ACTN|nr:glycoside hydrolase family 15 protein [Frankia nepalensis]MBL7500641.1 glycoside hydrolase family 15 protein [Frankia nepalensis]MBL7511398.1 glycoside hydrolase family 15 protein [Frankia nepalensis]MBL7521769.1 glycoside hydrolase family 15 protein [Frankia nepalensis]MBL7631494.1 glycoside hydrolase family 15 protein [Frankia nepalensis]